MPSSRRTGSTFGSGSRVHSEYSDCRAVTGWTAWARRIVSAPASDRPMWRILPAVTSSARRRRCLRWVCSGRRGAGSRGRCGRCRAVGGALDRGADVGGAAVQVPDAAAGVGDEPELGRQHDLVAPVLDRPADELLVGVGPVDLGGVDEGDAEVERPVDGADRLGVVGARPGVGGGHAHAAEADAADVEVSDGGVLHDWCSLAGWGRAAHRRFVVRSRPGGRDRA